MTRRTLLSILVVLLSLVTLWGIVPSPAQAGGQRWSAWMFDADRGVMYLLTDGMNGSPQSFKLPLPAGYDAYSHSVAISHNWHYMAYAVLNNTTGAHLLVIYDREASKIAFTFPVPGSNLSVDFAPDENIFNEDNTAIAFGYSMAEKGWELKVLSYAAPAGVPTLRHDSPAIAALGIQAQFMMPVPRRFANNQVFFTMIRVATEGSPNYNSYVWDVTSGAVQPYKGFPTLDTDFYLPTGEQIYGASDNRFPGCGQPCSSFFVYNTLNVYDSKSNSSSPFYATQQLAMFGPIFIQNGERILASGSDQNGQNHWFVVSRDGTTFNILDNTTQVGSVIGMQDGFLYMPAVVNPTGSPQLYAVNTRTGAPATLVWTGKKGDQVRLMQTPGNQQSTGPFGPWRRLVAGPVSPTLAPAQPTTPTAISIRPAVPPANPPASPGVLAVGKRATINTTEGDKLRLRSGPGTSFAILTVLPKGTVVTLLEGPRFADELFWWRVRTPDGTEGWVIQSVNDNGTMLQTLIPIN